MSVNNVPAFTLTHTHKEGSGFPGDKTDYIPAFKQLPFSRLGNTSSAGLHGFIHRKKNVSNYILS